MKQLNFKKLDKNEKRRSLFEKKEQQTEARIANYGSDSVAVVARALNHRIIATILAIVFIVSSLFLGINFAAKAVQGDVVAIDSDYSTGENNIAIYDFESNYRSSVFSDYEQTYVTGTVSFVVENGLFKNITVNTNSSAISGDHRKWRYTEGSGWSATHPDYVNRVVDGATHANQNLQQLIGQPATLDTFDSIVTQTTYGNYEPTQAGYRKIIDAFKTLLKDAPTTPNPVEVPDIVDPYVPPIPESAEAYLEVNKTISANANGNAYDLTLDAYSTADISSYSIKEKVPTDYVIVIDQSGSMARRDMPTNYKAAGNLTLEEIAEEGLKDNGKQYYYNDGENTYRVFADRGYLFEYFPSNSKWVRQVVQESEAGYGWFQREEEGGFDVQNQYWYRDETNPDSIVYRPVTVTVQGKFLRYYVKLRYTDSSGDTVWFHYPDKPYYKPVGEFSLVGIHDPYTDGQTLYGTANAFVKGVFSEDDTCYTFAELPVFSNVNTGMYINYPMYKRHVGYTRLLYRDKNGEIQVVPTKDGIKETEYCDTNSNALTTKEGPTRMVYSGLLEGKDYDTRLSSLNTALQYFAQTLQHDVDSFGIVDNRVAIVGFSSQNQNNHNYDNTEVLTGSTLYESTLDASSGYFPNGYNYNGPQYYNNTYGDINTAYGTALIDATVTDANGAYLINQELLDSIDALTAYGGTQPEDGLVMAKEIYDARTTEECTYTWRSGQNKGTTTERNKVVIFFTDGQPGNYSNDNQYLEANDVVEAAKDLKDDDVNIFSIGVFGVSDGEPLTYEAHNTSTPNKDYEYESGHFYKYDTTSTSWWILWPTETTNTHYLNRYWHTGEVEQYGETPTDTIYDYMSVVSSRYPDAEKFIVDSWRDKLTDDNTPENHVDKNGDQSNWLNMIESVRGTEDPDKNYYRLAANPESLIDAFVNAASAIESEENQEAGSISEDTILRDVIDTNNFKLTDNTAVEVYVVPSTKLTNVSPIVEGSPVQITDGSIQFDPNPTTNTIEVSGFDFNDHHIAHTNNQKGQKLRVVIKNIVPQDGVTGDALLSNTDTSGIYADDTANAEMLKQFPEPAIARYKYELNVGNVDADATIRSAWSLAANQGTTADFDNILISDAGNNRQRYNSDYVRTKTATEAIGDIDDTVYLEYIIQQGKNGVVNPADYNLTTGITATNEDASSYTYYLSDDHFLYGDEQTPTAQLENVTPVSFSTTSNGAMYVTSIANTHVVTITEETKGEFANKERAFPIELMLKKSDGYNFTGDIPMTGSVTGTLHFDNGVLDNASKALLKLADGQSVQLTVPSNATLTVTPTDAPLYTHSVDKGPTVIDNDTTTIKVTYTRDEVTETGVSDDNDFVSAFIYILAGMSLLVGGGAGVYLIRKKDELVE